MAFRLPRLPDNVSLIDTKTGFAVKRLQQWWQSIVTKIETQEASQDDILAALTAVDAKADSAITDAATAQAAADAAQADADAAAAAAAAAQAAADAIVVPPSGTQTVSVDTSLTPDDYSVLVDATSGVRTITLYAAAASLNTVIVQKIDASANSVDVVRTGGDTLNGGGAPVSLTTQYEQRTFVSDGTSGWYA